MLNRGKLNRSLFQKEAISKILLVLIIFSMIYILIIVFMYIPYDRITYNQQTFYIDKLFILLMIIYLLIILVGLGIAYSSTYNIIYYWETIFIMLIIILFSCSLIIVNDLMYLYILYEGLSLGSYILIGSSGPSSKINEALLKYYLYSLLSSLCLLFGIVLIYSIYGLLNLSDIQLLLQFKSSKEYELIFVCGLLFILVALIFKLGLYPFHYWVIEIYSGVNLFGLYMLSLGFKFIYIIILYKLIIKLYIYYIQYFGIILLFIGFSSIVISTFGILYVDDIRRSPGYSSISNLGFIIINFYDITHFSVYTFFVSYIIYNIILICFIYLYNQVWLSNRTEIRKYSDLALIMRNTTFLYKFVFFINFLSLGGIPPFIGFFSKYLIFLNLASMNDLIGSYYLIISLLFLNLISLYAYMRLYIYIYYNLNIFDIIRTKNFNRFVLVSIIIINIFGVFLIQIFYKFIYICFANNLLS